MITRYILTLCTALVIAGTLIGGSAHDEKTPINDTGMTAKTKIVLFADARVKGSEINVETSQGSEMIRGKVDSDEAKQATKGIDGIMTVKIKRQVVAPSKREAIDDSDASITIRVNAQFAKDSSLKDAGIHTQTNAGAVSLSGEVSSLMISDHAFWTVWQVPGVKWVKNGLTVKEKT